ncbi:MAG: DNA damage-inducible protein D [Peptococcaceae bacterium]
MNNIQKHSDKTFEDIKHINEYGAECWLARELASVLEYARWENFYKVLEKAREACENSNINVEDHFRDVTKMIELAKGAKREIEDIELSRYACYLIVQNADPRKSVVALGQTYFAVQTRRQELQDEFNKLDENAKRLAIRGEIRGHNKSLAEAAQMAGVETPQEYAVFQNKGYQGLYGGLGVKEIRTRKGLKKREKILDHMGSTELAANLFRATQTDEKIRREKIKGKEKANRTHYVVGKTVRDTIEKLGGTMPEDLPTPGESIKQLEKKEPKRLTGKNETE